jgi:hypothetical protein
LRWLPLTAITALLLAGCGAPNTRTAASDPNRVSEFVYQPDPRRPLWRVSSAGAEARFGPAFRFNSAGPLAPRTVVEEQQQADGWVQIVQPEQAQAGNRLRYVWVRREPLLPIQRTSPWPETASTLSGQPVVSPEPTGAGTPTRVRTAPQASGRQMNIFSEDLRCESSLFGLDGGYSDCTVSFSVGLQLPPEGQWSADISCQVSLEARGPDDFLPRTITGSANDFIFGRSGFVTTFHTARIQVRPLIGAGPTRVRLNDISCQSFNAALVLDGHSK